MKNNRLRPLASLTLAFSLVACGSPATKSDMPTGSTDGAWVKASPVLQQQIDDEAKRLPWTHGFERLEQIRWFASIGEPGYDTLLELAADPRDDVAAAALAAIGATLDRRLVTYVREVAWTSQRMQGDLRLERARTLVRLGDWSEIPVLIDGLDDERIYTRTLCFEALQEATHETQGFDPRSSEEARKSAIARWEQWWFARSGDGLLSARD